MDNYFYVIINSFYLILKSIWWLISFKKVLMTDRQTDICHPRAAFAEEKFFLVSHHSSSRQIYVIHEMCRLRYNVRYNVCQCNCCQPPGYCPWLVPVCLTNNDLLGTTSLVMYSHNSAQIVSWCNACLSIVQYPCCWKIIVLWLVR